MIQEKEMIPGKGKKSGLLAAGLAPGRDIRVINFRIVFNGEHCNGRMNTFNRRWPVSVYSTEISTQYWFEKAH
jgi:hypothetical protein